MLIQQLMWQCVCTIIWISPDDVDDGRDFMEKVNTDSLVVMNGKAEPVIKEYDVGSRF